jgi:hypothetical protein
MQLTQTKPCEPEDALDKDCEGKYNDAIRAFVHLK